MINREALLHDLKATTKKLIEDLRKRSDDVPDVRTKVRSQYDDAKRAGRTKHSYEEWRKDLLAQVAVGWVLATVFVRFCEDNRLYAEPLLSGPGSRRELAGDHRAHWLARHPEAGDREWLEEVFSRYRAIPAVAGIFGPHNPLWQFGPTADGARLLLEVWRTLDDDGSLRHDFTDPSLDTRFLGDLYQDLSEHAKKTYALLQTPEFVESFILDHTLDPAIRTFGLERIRMIDPTCGSGHFLLGAFDRLLEQWRNREPGTSMRELAQRALDAVHGVDLNPFAVAIARFRLLVTSLRAAGVMELADAPAFRINVATGDSLLHGRRSGRMFTGAEELGPVLRHRYPTEDEVLANELLQPGRYHVVVGNPPYITVKDAALRDAYRTLYETASGKYSLGVPFTERFVELAVTPSEAGEAGFVGMITTNTFMKRTFGTKLVEDFLTEIDLTHIIDTSGAYIPGHGTPTVILFARHQSPVRDTVRSVLGIRGEPATPDEPALGKVWSSILNLMNNPGAENEFVSVEDAPRDRYWKHPWSLQGGSAPSTMHRLESKALQRLSQYASAIGFIGISGADGQMLHRIGIERTFGLEPALIRPLIEGTVVRDWSATAGLSAYFPYQSSQLVSIADYKGWHRVLWPHRTTLSARPTFSQRTYAEEGRPWWEWHQVALDRLQTPLSIAFAFVATHNHFVLDRGGNVFKQSALVMKLAASATEEDHLKLLGLLNSSTACFWMKQVFHNKGDSTDSAGARVTGVEAWVDSYEHDGTKLKQFPIPGGAPLDFARALDNLARQLTATLPAEMIEREAPTRRLLDAARERATAIRARMLALQEELDWECYSLYGMLEENLTLPADEVPDLQKGERAFEILLARGMTAGEAKSTWFDRHSSTPISVLPAHWPASYRQMVERRIALIEADRSIRLLERPEYKRRWNWDPWEDHEREALRRWLLDRLEVRELWREPEVTTTARLADRVRRDTVFVEALRLYDRNADADLAAVLAQLIAEESVPYSSHWRFTEEGQRKRREWEEVWTLQRLEDALDARRALPTGHPQQLDEDTTTVERERLGLDRIPVPPKYRKEDYADDASWKLRGKLDVPQERFIVYPGTRRGADASVVVGWAGWDHLERARALAAHYTTRRQEGAEPKELTGLLAGLEELVPWLIQWHNEMDAEFGQRMGDFFASFVDTEARSLGLTSEALRVWMPE